MAVGVVSYNGYTKSARKSAAKNTMQQIALMQTEYYSITSGYYTDSCPPSTGGTQNINEKLFDADSGESVIGGEGYDFCITTAAEGGYEIQGTGDDNTLTLDAKGQSNFQESDLKKCSYKNCKDFVVNCFPDYTPQQ